ncbi:hypothetical protein [Planctomyces sp. SH-PL14]|uniref:hypothetical protein n=1 Tax=Planctomyces sp. SH-PL14 TaxID=1632864 RepID=UPI00094647E4|nr:hypothetical protein [Planctomyces sp. SH-PL14]
MVDLDHSPFPLDPASFKNRLAPRPRDALGLNGDLVTHFREPGDLPADVWREADIDASVQCHAVDVLMVIFQKLSNGPSNHFVLLRMIFLNGGLGLRYSGREPKGQNNAAQSYR